METELLNLLLRQTKSTYINDTTANDGNWHLIDVVSDTVFEH